MKQRTQIEYARRLQAVVAWLGTHMDEPPDLYRMAEIACLSPYHFHRVYRAMLGETVAATVQRMRLHRASIDLRAGVEPLSRVAQRAGYESPAAFNRAFAGEFGLPPGRYRADRSRPFTQRMEPSMYQVNIERFPGMILAALEHRGDYQQIGTTFDQLLLRTQAQQLAEADARSFGVYYDDPEQVAQADLRASAGVQIEPGRELAGDLVRLELPAGRYATLDYVGPYGELEAPYAWLFGQWLPQSGEAPGEFPVFEEYLNDPRDTPAEQLRTRIFLSLR